MGFAPLMVVDEHRGMIPLRVLRLMGDGTFETDHAGAVATGADSRSVVEKIVAHLDRLHWDLAVLGPIPEGSLTQQVLMGWLGARGTPYEERLSPCPVAELPRSFDAVLSRMPSRFRTSLRSSRKRLGEKYTVEFGLHETAGEMPAALETLFCNHASRWEAKDSTGVFVIEQRRRFYTLLAQRLRERGWLYFFYLKLDGKIVAQQFCFGYGGTVFLLQEGFDYAFAKENVGNTLRGLVFEYLIDRDFRMYDFLAGESRHKSNWSTGIVNDWRVTAPRRNLRGLVAFHGARLGRRVRESLGRNTAVSDSPSGAGA